MNHHAALWYIYSSSPLVSFFFFFFLSYFSLLVLPHKRYTSTYMIKTAATTHCDNGTARRTQLEQLWLSRARCPSCTAWGAVCHG